MQYVTKASGEVVSYTNKALTQITVQLAAAGQARCSGEKGLFMFFWAQRVS